MRIHNGAGGRVEMPDPTAPVPIIAKPTIAAGLTRRGQRERRARILAATRLALTQKIEDDLTIRDVASRSKVSAQTIYNLVGNRAQLVEDAINEHITHTAAHAHRLKDYPNIFLAIADLTWMSISQNPDYSRKIILACDSRYFSAYRKICDRNSRSLHRLLKRHYDDAPAAQSMLPSLAWHTTTLVGSSALEWARGLYDLAELRHRFAFAYGAPLMTIARPNEWADIRDWIEHVRHTES